MDSDAQCNLRNDSPLTNSSGNKFCPTDDTLIHAPPSCQSDPAISMFSSKEYQELPRTHDSDSEPHAQSLYTRLKTLFIPNSKTGALPTPPASPQRYRSRKLTAAAVSSLPHEHVHSPVNRSSPYPADSNATVSTRVQVTPLTPESIDLRRRRASVSFPSLDYVAEDFVLNEVEADCTYLHCEREARTTEDGELLDLGESMLENSHSQAIPSTLQLSFCDPKQDISINYKQGVHLVGDEYSPGEPEAKSVRWGKTPKPPIQWEVLIDDISWPVAPVGERFDSTNAAHYAYNALSSGTEDEQNNFYGLQYALELSRRDRRKIMDSNPNSAGEYSKSRDSWAILHIDRVLPSHQEYWFRRWLQWHCRLEDKAAFKSDRAQKREGFKRYQMVNPWPTTDRRTARHPRRADEDLHPTLRLVRHRTRSAPGRIPM